MAPDQVSHSIRTHVDPNSNRLHRSKQTPFAIVDPCLALMSGEGSVNALLFLKLVVGFIMVSLRVAESLSSAMAIDFVMNWKWTLALDEH